MMRNLLIAIVSLFIFTNSTSADFTYHKGPERRYVIGLEGLANWSALTATYTTSSCIAITHSDQDETSVAPSGCAAANTSVVKHFHHDIFITKIVFTAQGLPIIANDNCGFQLFKSGGTISLGAEIVLPDSLLGGESVSAIVNETLLTTEGLHLLARETGLDAECAGALGLQSFAIEYIDID